MQEHRNAVGLIRDGVAMAVLLIGLYWAKTYQYLLFHTLAELFSIITGAAIFIVAWNSRRFHADGYLTFLGIAFLFVAGLDLLHTLTYKGLSIFPGYDTNVPTQLWIAARYMESLSLLAAPWLIGRHIRPAWLLAGFTAVFVLMVLTVFQWGLFPTCFIEGYGLTAFKRTSEYVICIILLAAMAGLWSKRTQMDAQVLRLLLAAMAVTVAQELAFTFYHDAYGTWNFVGHCLKLLAFFLVYKAIVETGLAKPYELLFFNLRQSEQLARRQVTELEAVTAERRLAEEATRESEERFRTLALASFEGICISEEARIRDCNGQLAAMLGYEREELLGKEIADLLPLDAREMVLRNLRTAAEVTAEHELICRDGALVAVETHGKTITHQGRAVRITVIRDVTLRKQAEQTRQALLDAERAARAEVERAIRIKDEFLATVSHELRSPLSAILGWTRLLRVGRIPDVDHALGVVERSGEALAGIVDDMLDMGRIMSGKVRLNLQEAEPKSLTEDVVDGFRPPAQAKGITLHETYAPDMGSLYCDPARMRQVLSNLLTNALKFTPAGGRVFIGLRRRGERIQWWVRDTGQGIAREFLPQLFGKFLQADTGTTRRHGGLGLGLAIVKQLVELHEGTIRASSAGKGKGAVFVVTLPRARFTPFAADALAAPVSADEDADSDGLELPWGMDVLLVDDQPDALSVISRVLTDSRAHVIVATSVEEALRCFQERRPRLVVSDISMPGEDGYSLVRKIRALDDPQRPTICVALSALARPEDKERAMEAGFDAHLSKLAAPTAIVRSIRDLLLVIGDEPSAIMPGDEPSAEAPALPHGTHHLLLAEDNEVIAKMLKVCLEHEGYRVSTVPSVAAGIEVAAREPVHLLLSDLQLKDGMGWDLLAGLRETGAVPAIMMSGYSDEDAQERSRQAGFEAYLLKPVDADVLCDRIARVLARKPSAPT